MRLHTMLAAIILLPACGTDPAGSDDETTKADTAPDATSDAPDASGALDAPVADASPDANAGADTLAGDTPHGDTAPNDTALNDTTGDDTAPNDTALDDTTDAAKSTTDPPVDTSMVKLSACPTQWSKGTFPWTLRPSSGRTCYIPPAAGTATGGDLYRCLPWEWCDKGFIGTAFTPPPYKVTGSLRCYRRCGKPPYCPKNAKCVTIKATYGDYTTLEKVCPIPKSPAPWPAYSTAKPPPAEGGLGCWTSVVQTTGYNAGSRIARVGPHVYLLFWDLYQPEPPAVVAKYRLLHVPLAAPVSPDQVTTLIDQSKASSVLTSVAESGQYLVALRRPVPAAPSPGKTPIPHEVLFGKPAADGKVTLAISGQTLKLTMYDGAHLTGSRQACLLVHQGTDLAQVCFPVANGKLKKVTVPLNLPKSVRDALAATKAKQGGTLLPYTRPWNVAVSNNWMALSTGKGCDGDPFRLHVAAAVGPAVAMGPWVSTTVLQDWLGDCAPLGPLWMQGDVLLARGMTTRITASKPGDWLAATMPPLRMGYLMDWTGAGDLLLGVYLKKLTGQDPPAHLVVNRVLW